MIGVGSLSDRCPLSAVIASAIPAPCAARRLPVLGLCGQCVCVCVCLQRSAVGDEHMSIPASDLIMCWDHFKTIGSFKIYRN